NKRIALYNMSKVGTQPGRLVIGTILVSFVLAVFVPCATAHAGTLVPILMGMTAAFVLARDSTLSALLIITPMQSITISNIGIKTDVAQNMVALGFMESEFGIDISWGLCFLYAAPCAVIMSVILYFVMNRLIKPDASEIEGKGNIKQQLDNLGAITTNEKRLI